MAKIWLVIASMALFQISAIRATVMSLHEPLYPRHYPQRYEARATGADYRLPETVSPQSYIITLTPNFNDFTFNGEVEIKVKIEEENVTSIKLHHDVTAINNCTITDNTEKNVPVTGKTYNEETQIYDIQTDGLVKEAIYTVTITYTGVLRTDMAGFYRSSYVDDNGKTRWLAATQFEPTDARSAFPCFDEPGFKAKFQIKIVRSQDMGAISNTVLYTTSKPAPDGTVTDTFKESPEMSTYLVAFIVSDFKQLTTYSKNRTYSVWSRYNALAQAGYSVSISPGIIEFMENFTNVDYTFGHINEAALPDFSAGAMENWALVTYRERLLLYKEDAATTANKQSIASVIAHEFSHQWFGDLVSPKWWDYLWLNEGFATYFEYFATLGVEPNWRLEEQFVVDIHHNALAVDALSNTHPITAKVYSPLEINSIFDSISYDKAGSILRTVEHFLTTETFKKGLENYLNNNSLKAAEPNLLFKELEAQQQADGIFQDTGLNVTTILESWTTQSGYPVIIVNKTNTGFTLFQKRFLIAGANDTDDTLWWVPITYTKQNGMDFVDTKPKLWLENVPETSVADELGDGWYIFNIQETGFYRVLYDDTNYDLLTEYLQTADYNKIHVINRAQLIDDALNLARAGMLKYSKALKLTQVLAVDDDYIPWRAYFNNIGFLNTRLAGEADLYERFKTYVLNLISNHYSHIGFYVKDTDDHVTKLSRVNMVSWACNFGHTECVAEATELFDKWMGSNSSTMISPDIRSAVFCTAINRGGSHHWDHLFERYLATDVSTEQVLMLTALGCTADATLLTEYLTKTITENSGIRDQDAKTVFSSVYNRPEGVDAALDFLIDKFEDIKIHYVAMGTIEDIVTGLASKLTTQDQFDKLKELFDAHAADLAQVIESATETVTANLNWLEKYKQEFNSWLPEPSAATLPSAHFMICIITFIGYLIAK